MYNDKEYLVKIGKISMLIQYINYALEDSTEEYKEKMRPLIDSFLYMTGVKVDESGFIPGSYKEVDLIVKSGRPLKLLEHIEMDIIRLADEDYERGEWND